MAVQRLKFISKYTHEKNTEPKNVMRNISISSVTLLPWYK